MRTSALSLEFRSHLQLAVVELEIAVALAVTITIAGCGPTTPHVGLSPPGVASADAGVEAPRVPPPVGIDAGVERAGAVNSGSGGAPGCAPIGSDGGGVTTSIADASGADAVRQAEMDSGGADVRGSDDAATTTGGRGGAGGGNAGAGGTGRSGEGGSVGSGGLPGPSGTGGVGTGGSTGSGGAPGSGGGASAGVAGAAGSPNAAGGAAAGGSNSLAPAPAPGELAIVELLINPASTDTGREWIEIVNRTGHALSLAGLHISDAANDAAVDFGGAVSATLVAAGARIVLIQSADSTKNGGVMLGGATPGGSFGTLVSLNNDADTISICVGPCATGQLIDRVAWDAGLGTGYDGHALVIDDSVRRCPATLPFGDAGSFGTPGAANGPCP